MRHALTALAAATLMFAAGCANEPAPPLAPASETATTVEQLERDWVEAIVKNDAAAIDRLLAPDFAGTSPTAHSYDRNMALADLKSGLYKVKSMNLDEVSANVYGDTAVAFTSQQEESAYGETDTSGHYHYTNVWVRNDGQWRVVASHGSRYAQAH
jgi:ketosteroid isomerase-like protein